MSDFFRPNFFTNTPDILSPILQRYGRPAFKMRLVLAATLSPSYGIYSGYELCENQAVPGTEDYLNSEKYEIRTRDWHAPATSTSSSRASTRSGARIPASACSPTCASWRPTATRSCATPRPRPNGGNIILVAVNLDPAEPHYCTAVVPPRSRGSRAGRELRSDGSADGFVVDLGRAQLRAARSCGRAGSHSAGYETHMKNGNNEMGYPTIRCGTRTRFFTSCACARSTTATATGSGIFPA